MGLLAAEMEESRCEGRPIGGRRSRAVVVLVLGTVLGSLLPGRLSYAAADGDDEALRFVDPWGDAVPRPMDPGALGLFNPIEHRLPDLLELAYGAWDPDDAAKNLFVGRFLDDDLPADFARIDLLVDGLQNPPGDVHPGRFAPFAYGPHPLYGFVEFDMDKDKNTGGELLAPQYRYLGNLVRFGGNAIEGAVRDRTAQNDAAFDHDISTHPLVDRSGEDFHLAFLGGEFGPSDIEVILGDSDNIFEAGETWRIWAPFLHRAHGYEEFSFAKGGSVPGAYMPAVQVQFTHDLETDRTVVSVVFPLNQRGAGRQFNQVPEPFDQDAGNHASVHEGLNDLRLSAQFFKSFPSGNPNEVIIIDWEDENPAEFLEPDGWAVTVLLGSSYSQPTAGGVYYVWSDVFPNVIRGDVDGNGSTDDDPGRIAAFIVDFDASDGVWDGVVSIGDFARDFSVHDVNHDGIVDGLDLLFAGANGDSDKDGDVDLRDFARWQKCFASDTRETPECLCADLDLSGFTELYDLRRFRALFSGVIQP